MGVDEKVGVGRTVGNEMMVGSILAVALILPIISLGCLNSQDECKSEKIFATDSGGQCKEFSTTCLPVGWTKVDKCPKEKSAMEVDKPQFRIISPKEGEEIVGLFYPEAEVEEGIEWTDIEWFLSNGSWTRKVGSGGKTLVEDYGGNYSLILRIKDKEGNIKNDSIHITIKSPELYINSDDVQISPYPPVVGKNATIRAKVQNEGDVDSNDFYTVFAYGEKEHVDVTVGRITIDSLPAKSSRIITANFTPVKEVDAIILIVDREDWVPESNEENNYIYLEFDGSEGRYVVIENG